MLITSSPLTALTWAAKNDLMAGGPLTALVKAAQAGVLVPPPHVVGTWGVVLTFKVGLEESITFRNQTRQRNGRWSEHVLVGNVTRLEHLGPALTELSLTVDLNVAMGQHVQDRIDRIEKAVDQGEAQALWLGGRKIGRDKMVITSANTSVLRYYQNGEPTAASVALTFREYRSKGV